MSLSTCKRISLLFSRSRSQQRLIWSKYDSFYYICRSADQFASKLGFMVHYCKPVCLREKLDWCQGQQNSKMLMNACPDDIFWIIEPFTTNLGMGCIIMSQIVSRKIGWLSSRSRSQWRIISAKYNFLICLLNCWSLQLTLVWWLIVISWIVFWKDWIALLWSRSGSQKRSRIPLNVHLDEVFSTPEPSVTKLCMVMHHHGSEVMQDNWFAVFKVRVTVKADIIRYDCSYHICWTADLFATTFNWMVHHHKLECVV